MSNLYQYNGRQWIEIAKNGKDATVDYDFILSQIPKAKDGRDGINGSPDTGEEIVEKLNPLQNVLDFRTLKNVPDFVLGKDVPHGSSAGGGQVLQFQDEGTLITQNPVSYLNVVGTGSSIAYSGNGVATLTISAGGTPGGSDTQVQFNDAGAFGGNSAFTFDKTTGNLSITTVNGATVWGVNDAEDNTLFGFEAGLNRVSGAAFNTFIGHQAGRGGTMTSAADNNTAVGYISQFSLTSGQRNSSLGRESLSQNTTGIRNTAVGYLALGIGTAMNRNTAVGYAALQTVDSGNNNVALGHFAGAYETGSNAFYIDNQDRTDTAGDKAGALLYGTFNATPASQTLKVNGTLSTLGGLTKRVVTTTDDATAVIDVTVTDTYELSAIANNTTFSTTGTPTDGQQIIIRWKDAGVSKTLTWDAIFVAIGVTLPTSTTAGKWQYVGVIYNSGAGKFHATAVGTQA